MQSRSNQLISALTLRAIFFSFFIAENCFSQLRTAESRGLSGATPSTQTQGDLGALPGLHQSLAGAVP
jgi:hypothetical protein